MIVDGIGIDVEGHPITDVSGLSTAELRSFPLSRFTLLPRTGHLPQVETPEVLLGALLDD